MEASLVGNVHLDGYLACNQREMFFYGMSWQVSNNVYAFWKLLCDFYSLFTLLIISKHDLNLSTHKTCTNFNKESKCLKRCLLSLSWWTAKKKSERFLKDPKLILWGKYLLLLGAHVFLLSCARHQPSPWAHLMHSCVTAIREPLQWVTLCRMVWLCVVVLQVWISAFVCICNFELCFKVYISVDLVMYRLYVC